jgi:hypothetical protein
MQEESQKVCVFCQRNEHEVSLVGLDFKGSSYWICPQHIPVLIHNPAQLEGLLPGAENLEAG